MTIRLFSLISLSVSFVFVAVLGMASQNKYKFYDNLLLKSDSIILNSKKGNTIKIKEDSSKREDQSIIPENYARIIIISINDYPKDER